MKKEGTIKAGKIIIKMMIVLITLSAALMYTVISVEPHEAQRIRAEEGSTRFYIRNININGTKISNYHLTDPFFLYQDSVYIPITVAVGNICGFGYLCSEDNEKLLLTAIEPAAKQLQELKIKRGDETVPVTIRHDLSVLVNDEPKRVESVTNGCIYNFDPEGAYEMDLGGLPVLQGEDDVFYLPLKAFSTDPVFSWDIYHDLNYGICLSTSEGIEAKSFWNAKESKYNQGLAAYIRSRNQKLKETISQEYAFYFSDAAERYKVHVEWLMAISQCESGYRPEVVSPSGAVGMMQIMPATGEAYGLSVADLKNPKKNIDFGAKYFGQLMSGYSGDRTRALSAYKMGIAAENVGGYETSYAETITWAYNNLNAYLSSHGYQ